MPRVDRLPNQLIERGLTKLSGMQRDTPLAKAGGVWQAMRIIRNTRDFLASKFVGHDEEQDEKMTKPAYVRIKREDFTNLLMALDEIDEYVTTSGRRVGRREAQGSILDAVVKTGDRQRKKDGQLRAVLQLWLEKSTFMSDEEIDAKLLQIADRLDGSYLRGGGRG